MATEKPIFLNNKNPLEEQEEEDPELEADYKESSISYGSCCFGFCCFRRLRKSADITRRSLLQGDQNREAWYMNKMKKLKELSEFFAGPKWKTFIRKFNSDSRKRKPQFQYDPLSYALNFDDGVDREGDDDELLGFSTRRAAPPGGSELGRDPAGFALNRS